MFAFSHECALSDALTGVTSSQTGE